MFSPLQILAFVSLAFAIIAPFYFNKRLSLGLAVISLISCFFADFININALGFLGLLALSCQLSHQKNLYIKTLASLSLIALTIGLFAHLLAGFSPWVWPEQVQFSDDGPLINFKLHIDKAFTGIFLINLVLSNQHSKAAEALNLKDYALMGLGIALIFALGLSFGQVTFNPHWHSLWALWLAKNLLLTIIAEELFFRAYIQQKLIGSWLKNPKQVLIVSSLIFGLLHFIGGWQLMITATLAGMLYGWVLQRAGRIEWSIGLHLLLNSIHFFFFSYPYLANS